MEYAKHTGRMGMKNNSGSGGDIIQVEGGHIVRSVGRKDRHSKVFTAKGPRDRRVRLSAHTAIQFYDVQDRLGYDRPSKAVDWLIKKAKSAIDKLAQLPPPYIPHATTDHQEDDDPNASTQQQETGMAVEESETPAYNNNFETYAAIEDTMKSFFPITSSTTNNPCINNFQNYPSQTEDLCLSLHSFPDQQALFTGSTSAPPQVGFHEANNYNQGTMAMVAASWNRERAREHEEEEEQGGFVFHSSQPLLDGFGPNMRGTLQSNFAPANSSASTFFTWNDLSIASEKNQRISSTSHDNQIHQSSIFGTRFSTDGYLGFNIPGRIGEDHENGIVSDRPSSSSSSLNSHH